MAAAAASVGLGYLQHIVAVSADACGDAFVYHATDEELLTLTHQTGQQRWAVAHLKVHADLLVFSSAVGPAAAPRPGRRRRDGGDRRG